MNQVFDRIDQNCHIGLLTQKTAPGRDWVLGASISTAVLNGAANESVPLKCMSSKHTTFKFSGLIDVCC